VQSKQTIKKRGIERENEIKIETGDKPQNILSPLTQLTGKKF